MIVDELVARIRFHVEGLKNLLAGKQAMASTTKAITANAAAANAASSPLRKHSTAVLAGATATAALEGRTSRLTTALLALRSVSKIALLGFAAGLAIIIKALGTAIVRVGKLGAALGVALGVGKLAAAVGGLAAVLGQAAGAVAGRRTQIDAAEAGTTKGRREALANFLSVETGMQGDDFAEKITSAVGSALLDVRKGGEGRAEAIQNFGKYGIGLTDEKTGLARDSTAVAMDLMRRAIDLRAERDNAKTKKQRVAADAKLAGLSDLGLTGGFVEALSNIKDFNGFLERFNAAQKDTPPQTDTQKTEEQRLAEEMGRTAAAARGLGLAMTDTIGEALRQFGPSLKDVTEAMRSATESVKRFSNAIADFAADPTGFIARKTLKATGVKPDDPKAPYERTIYDKLRDEVNAEQNERDARAYVNSRSQAIRAERETVPDLEDQAQASQRRLERDAQDKAAKRREARPQSGLESLRLGLREFLNIGNDLNRQALAGVNRDNGLSGRSGETQKVEAEAKIDVQSQVSVRVEPTSELLKVVATAKTMGAQIGSLIAKSANTATAGATAP